MKFRVWAGLAVLSIATGCATSNITRFHPEANYSPVQWETIGVYRVSRPFSPAEEIGLITFRTQYPYLDSIFNRLRQDAAPHGAEAVVDVKIKSETHTETVPVQECIPHTHCDANGMCSTETVCTTRYESKTVTTYLVEGSMIRRKQ